MRSRIEQLSSRADRLVRETGSLTLTQLRERLGCRASELLIAAGMLLASGGFDVLQEGSDKVIKVTGEDAAQERQ